MKASLSSKISIASSSFVNIIRMSSIRFPAGLGVGAIGAAGGTAVGVAVGAAGGLTVLSDFEMSCKSSEILLKTSRTSLNLRSISSVFGFVSLISPFFSLRSLLSVLVPHLFCPFPNSNVM